MPSRTVKESRLKDNYDQILANSKKEHVKDNGHSMSEARAEYEKKELDKALKQADKQLPYVWNDEKPKSIDDSKRPVLGTYFVGVNFDREGKIIR